MNTTDSRAKSGAAAALKDLVSQHVDGERSEASAIVQAFEKAWYKIKARHPEVPDVFMTIQSGAKGNQVVKYGHFSHGRWSHQAGARSECMLSGETLDRDAADLFETILHEAAHGVNATRSIQDTSRGGRFHNKKYARTAQEMGLEVSQHPSYGWCITALKPETTAMYSAEIEEITRVASGYKRLLSFSKEKKQRGLIVASCGCRKIRLSKKALEQGSITCNACNKEFEPEETEEENEEEG